MPLSRRAELTHDLPTRLYAYGDSITAAFGVDAATELYVAKTATARGWTLVNRSVSASMAADQANLAYSHEPSDRNKYSFFLGVNDADHYGTNTTRRDNGFIPFLRGLVAWHALPRKVIATDMAKTGAWSKTTVNAIGMNATGSGRTATATVYGTAVYVFAIIQNAAGSEGAADVNVDGVNQGSILLNGTTIGNTILGTSFALACWRFGGLSDAAHTVEVSTLNANTFFLDAIAGSRQPERPLCLVGNVIKRGAAGYTAPNSDANVADYNTAIATMISQFQTDGVNVVGWDNHSVITPATDLSDDIHPNVTGHNDMYVAQNAAIV